ncbi:hypothetical protein GUITHDRAFT_159882 [Guillardia theta CCMP2712]|uniref:Corrinoid adenosyltransferase MMAB n=1 Tax=Guillardia theta (strain CCMP2712) TaxID=905079 RepID=L1J018_GUITC|nr:hypothetical protein GUITHDRAFT_159882 [Guillardia theta CCMP2712]EKX41682.1 hypothetical protein GUITHDRAFT_159882 [Guillardia theta CCMP2712]|eukprot:XP_005828662.1 hypothetical protein GUITHDRAFT_159882 [Guillardia theta CCMP2712]
MGANEMEEERGRERQEGGRAATARQVSVYTRTGDKGKSSLYNGERRRKDDKIFHALGDIDELNSAVGIGKEMIIKEKVEDDILLARLEDIQCRLLDLGAHIATPTSEKTAEKVKRMKVEDVWVDDLELWIDEMDKELPPLKNFILPSGGLASATLHNARTVCRRAERNVVALQQDEQAVIDASAVRYLNRLSDFLFVSARRCAKLAGKPEALYQSGHGLKTRSH